MMLFVGCTQFDDTRIWDAIDELEDLFDDLDNRVEDLEEACEKMNTNIEALQTLVAALQANDTITAIAPIKQGDKIIGYTISFSKSEPITIYHGNDGKDGADGEDGKDGENGADGEDGYTPQIGIAKDSDNVYYWTLDGEWLLDENGNKIKAVGTDGKDGEDGEDGKDGADGEDGKDGEDGTNGTDGQDGKDGDSLFQSVTWDEEYAYFTLSDGTVIKIPLAEGAVSEVLEIIAKYYLAEYEGSWDDIHAYEIKLTDTYNFLEEKYDNEESNCNLYNIAICTNEEPGTGVLPNGTYVLSTTLEAGTLIGVEGGECYIRRNGEWEEVYAPDAVLVISDNKIDGTFTLENGEVHHVVYEGSLVIGEEGGEDGGEDDTNLPPANEIWYTSTDGEVVTPYEYAFGVNIISNTYENGVGIITFDGDVTSIGAQAFEYCSSLASVTIPDSVASIGGSAFNCCSSLAEFRGKFASEDGLCLMIDGVFIDGVLNSFAPAGLTEYTIPDSVTEIGYYAFINCTSLTSVYCKASTPPSLGVDAFYGNASECKIYVPTESVDAYKTANYWSDYDYYIEGYDF